MTHTKTSKTFGFLKLYFTVISIAGVVGMVVSFGIALSQWINTLVVSDEEYIAGNHLFYELQSCETNTLKTPEERVAIAAENNPEKDELQIKLCKQEVTSRMLTQRTYNTKTAVIGGLVRGCLFLILFATHFPTMLKERKEG